MIASNMKFRQILLVFGGIMVGIVFSLFVKTSNAESVITQNDGTPIQEVVQSDPSPEPVAVENPVVENQPAEQTAPSAETTPAQPAPCSL